MIPYGKQLIDQNDIDAVLSVLTSDFLTQGPQVPLFEKTIADYCTSEYAIAVNSATSALHIACLALGLGEGDILWTSPNTFVASANVGLLCRAKVDFVDIDAETYNMSVDALEQKLIDAEKLGCLPKIVMPVHFAGQSCDMKAISALAKRYGFFVIEDASHAIGGRYLNQPVGSCAYSDITVFSFHPVKIITTAEGGVAVTNQSALAEKMQLLRSHGVTRDPLLMVEPEMGGWYYQQVDLGLNYRMTELQGALGVSQMKHLDEFVTKRHQLASQYAQELNQQPLVLPYQAEYAYSSYHLYPIQVLDAKDRLPLFNHLRDNDIGVNVHYIPVHTQPYYQQNGFKDVHFPAAERYYQHSISIPLHQGMTDVEQRFVVETIKRFFG